MGILEDMEEYAQSRQQNNKERKGRRPQSDLLVEKFCKK